jgi:hypothetical protein
MAPSSVGGNSDEPVPASADETQSRASYHFFWRLPQPLATVQRHTTVSQRSASAATAAKTKLRKQQTKITTN